MAKISGTTPSGWQFELEDSVFDNMELVDALVAADENPIHISTVCRLMLGDKRKELYDHLRTEDGRVPLTAVMEELMAIFSSSQSGKK